MKTLAYETLHRVKKALEKSGYDSEGIISAKFTSWNDSDSEVHVITFEGEEGLEAVNVYIDKDGKGEF